VPLVQFRCLTGYAYRDKKVVGVFVRFRAPLQCSARTAAAAALSSDAARLCGGHHLSWSTACACEHTMHVYY
jgi:hypothetical protein